MAMFKRKKIEDFLTDKDVENNPDEEWLSDSEEGELTIDAYETEKEFVIQSTIAGVESKNLDISIEDDMLTIRGKRKRPESTEKRNYFQKECFWGSFSKKIILPERVKITQAKATIKNGILHLKIPKANRKTSKKIIIEDK
ncbi:MAG: Hsp20/alpha crystallin family protein [Patescibacteria group bacterium]|nr:Hsp20/alpha crystallin family protein [Patescibacteria group bacterium]